MIILITLLKFNSNSSYKHYKLTHAHNFFHYQFSPLRYVLSFLKNIPSIVARFFIGSFLYVFSMARLNNPSLEIITLSHDLPQNQPHMGYPSFSLLYCKAAFNAIILNFTSYFLTNLCKKCMFHMITCQYFCFL